MRVIIAGLGPGDLSLSTTRALDAIAEADAVIGARRLIEEVSDSLPLKKAASVHALVRTSEIVSLMRSHPEWKLACVVMSGDVGLFRGARALREALSADPSFQIDEIPGISSAQLFAARLGRPWQQWRFESAHGVACDIEALVLRGDPLFLVTGGDNTVASLCARLAEAGFGDAPVAVGERLSYEDERITYASAAELADRAFDPLSVMLVDPPRREAHWPWRTGGIPDDMFERGEAPMTKQEVRAVALSKLRVGASDTLYDIGAGTGSVTVEMALSAPFGSVIAIERHPEDAALVERNVRTFGLGNVSVVAGAAPDVFKGLPAPDAAFVGGSGGRLPEILGALLEANPRVRVCVPCVTLETLAQATELLSDGRFEGFEAVCVSISRAASAGRYHLMRALNPVHIVSAQGAMGDGRHA